MAGSINKSPEIFSSVIGHFPRDHYLSLPNAVSEIHFIFKSPPLYRKRFVLSANTANALSLQLNEQVRIINQAAGS